MIKKGKMPITGGKTTMSPKAPVKTDAMTPSADAERQIKQPPAPFANPNGPVNVPVHKQLESRGTDFSGPGKAARGTAIGGVKALPSGKPVGYSKLPDASKQIGGRFGTSNPRKSGNPVAGQKSKRYYGE
jgi:hypothetical protein